jgi:hypothetical protein
MRTTRIRCMTAVAFGLLLMGSAGRVAAQPAPVTLDKVPKRLLLATIQKAPSDQVFVVQGKRMTKQDIATQAKANYDQFVAQLPSVRLKMAALHKKSTDLVAQRLAAQKADLEAANAKAQAAVKAFVAGK